LIMIESDRGILTIYGHNYRNLVQQGKKVDAGRIIAEVGSTGRASGAHLHFEVRLKNEGRYVAVDPLPLLTRGSKERPRYRVNESLTPLLARLKSIFAVR
jgi:murein DD-endopeptidase MepM/ murein hydrolase activator NlpD